MTLALKRKDILEMRELSEGEIAIILDTASSFVEVSTREIKKVPTLRGKLVINLFFEASTRTRTSFEIAGKRLGADTINIAAAASSVVKGETLIDTARNLEAMNPDVDRLASQRRRGASTPSKKYGLPSSMLVMVPTNIQPRRSSIS